MFVPVLIFLACFGGGVFAATRWLPNLAEGAAGGVAYFVVCGLLGSALGLIALRLYVMVENLSDGELGSFSDRAGRSIVAAGLAEILFECGALLGVAAIVYLMAPARTTERDF